jgi:hypothetical protein
MLNGVAFKKMKMNIPHLFHSQKMPMAETMIPHVLTSLRKPSSAFEEVLSVSSVADARRIIDGRMEEGVQLHHLLRTGVSLS